MDDRSGPAIREALEAIGCRRFETRIVPDEIPMIRAVLEELAASCAVVFTTGGTGFGPRDVTPEATAPLLERLAPNLSELIRAEGLKETPFAHLSRGIAGVSGTCLIVNLPGSPKGAASGVHALAPLLPAIVSNLSGEGCTAH